MKLEKILRTVDYLTVAGPLNREITGLAYDSRKVQAGYLFAALPGASRDGRNFIGEAIGRGAAAVVSEPDDLQLVDVTCIKVKNARRGFAEIASSFHNDPSAKLQMVGITGTNGKTTIAFMVRDILRADDRSPGLLGTVCYEMGSRTIPASRTTPESSDLHSMLAEMVAMGCKSAVMEVSSHSLVQGRVWGVAFDAAVFTNLTHEHLDFHKTMEEYFAAKSILFRDLGYRNSEAVGIVNVDDPWGRRLMEMPGLDVTMVGYGCEQSGEVRAENVRLGPSESRFNLRTPWGNVDDVRMGLLGRFNVSNALAAAGVCGALGIKPSRIAEVLGKFRAAPGRIEEVPTGRNFRVIVDYAHTGDALENVLRALRETGINRVILVFGCGGNRDVEKRAEMGAVAARLASFSILTTDNPRREDPAQIIAQIKSGFAGHDNFEVQVDREQAIKRAVELAKAGDVVLIAGKGHESFQEFADTVVPFDDRQVVRRFTGAG
ncbi:MAG: UDP-N-acetylmuramoyl-L-alanyl-D-glutamate--2,6-diaminopimelate ligase [bacterium]